MKNHYNTLQLPPTCTQAEIKKAYRQLAVKYHPDKNNGNKASEEKFKELSEAYIILIGEETRNEYDYNIGLKSAYRNQRYEPGMPSPIRLLLKFKRIKETVLNAGGRINKEALFNVIDSQLSEGTIDFLIKEHDTKTNNLITDEILTSCIFLSEQDKSKLHEKLKRLSCGDNRFDEKISLLNKAHKSQYSLFTATEETPDTPPATTTILIFIMFILLFVLLLILA